MSHFTVLVIGDDVDGQLAKFDENTSMTPYWRLEAEKPTDFWSTSTWIEAGKLPAEPTMEQLLAVIFAEYGEENERYKIEDGKLYEESTYNPLSKWDWYQIGGRWRGFFTLKPGVTVGAAVKESSSFWTQPADLAVSQVGQHDGTQEALLGTPGTGETLALRDGEPEALRKNYSGLADQARKGAIDFEMMRVMAGAEAQETYDKFLAATKDLESPGRWIDYINAALGELAEREYRDLTDDEKVEFNALRDQARASWHALPWNVALRKNDLALFMKDEHTYYCLDAADPRTTFIDQAIDRIYSPFAIVKEGEWCGKGDMGWFGISTDEEDEATWNKKVRELVDSLPDDTLLTLLDCHI